MLQSCYCQEVETMASQRLFHRIITMYLPSVQLWSSSALRFFVGASVLARLLQNKSFISNTKINYYICHTSVAQISFITILGVRSLANASRARQFNPLGWVPLPQTNMAAVVGRAWSCAVMRVWSVIRGRAWSCVRGRAVLPASRPALPCCPLRGQHCRGTNERTNNI